MPKRTRDDLKRLLGTTRADRMRTERPVEQLASLRTPAGLSPAARRHWRALAPMLHDARLLTVLDTIALRLLCETQARLDAASAKASDDPIYDRIARRAYKQLLKLLAEFGMTPSARSALLRDEE